VKKETFGEAESTRLREVATIPYREFARSLVDLRLEVYFTQAPR
jgi:hypothetical protein